MFEKNGEWSGYAIEESEKGWIIETWSRIQGGIDGRKILVPYGAFGYQQGQDLEEDYNEIMTVGEALFAGATEDQIECKVLKKGQKVN